MMRFIRDTRGSTPLWVAFITLVLCMLAVLIYTGSTLYSTYQTAQTELERTANITVDESLVNPNVRDLLLDISESNIEERIVDNLALAGYVENADGDWERTTNGNVCYVLRGLQVSVSGKQLELSATVSIPLPWDRGGNSRVDLPIHSESVVLYLD